jgi:V/A-type H+/Na+-transporting ATPase subunit K
MRIAKPLPFALAALAIGVVVAATAALVALPARAAAAAAGGADPEVLRWAFVAAAAAAGLSAGAAGYAVAQVGSAAVGAVAEKPELFGRMLILVGLAEGIAIYGLIVAVLIFNRVGA